MINASIVEAPRQSLSKAEKAMVSEGAMPADWKPAKRREKDMDARWTKKHGKLKEVEKRRRSRVVGTFKRLAHTPLAAVIGAMLFGLLFPFAEHLDPGAFDYQMQAGRSRHNCNGDAQCLLPAAHGAVIRDRPI